MQQWNENVWVVRSGSNSIYVERFLRDGLVTIGWGEVGEIDGSLDDAEILGRFQETFPEAKHRTITTWAAQVKRFLYGVEIDDNVVTYDSGSRLYHIGVVRSAAVLRSPEAGGQERPEFVRSVDWKSNCSRDILSEGAQNQLGSTLTLFRISSDTYAELQRKNALEGFRGPTEKVTLDSLDESDDVNLHVDYIAKANEAIEDKIASLGWEQLQELVAGLVRAMGYRTRISKPGPDLGVDVFASPDGLGLAEPRIFVEVKHRRGSSIGAPDIRSFLGGRQEGDRCLYVSTGGFARDARYEAARSSIHLRLLDLSDLRQWLAEYYETLDSETRALLPLKKVFWPVSE